MSFASSKSVVKSLASASIASGGSKAAAVYGKLSSQDPALLQVEKKLRSLERYKALTGEELQEEVEKLTSIERILQELSHLVEHELIDVVEKQQEGAELVEHCRRKAYVQTTSITLKVTVKGVDPSVEILLHSFADVLNQDFGDKRVSLTVGDVVLEWGEESLISVVRLCGDEQDPPGSSVVAVEQRFERTLAGETPPMFEELAKLISKYNTKFYYNSRRRNSQAFVRDAITTLRVSDTL